MTDLDAISAIYTLAAIAVAVLLVRSWRSFWDERFTENDRRLAQAMALLFLVPPVVALHELGHAAAVWSVGGQVQEFAWRVFWGYVVPQGTFTATEWWWIALSGNVVSLAAALGMIALGLWVRRIPNPARYTLLLGGVLQVVLTLVGYPLLSIGGLMGDWVMVYDFRATPALSAVTALGHVGVLVGGWRWLRRGQLGQRMLALGYDVEDALDAMLAEVREHPDDPRRHIALAELYGSRGETALALTAVRRGRRTCGDRPELSLAEADYLLRAGKTSDAVYVLQEAVDQEAARTSWHDQLLAALGIALVNDGKHERGRAIFDELPAEALATPHILFWRGAASRQLGDLAGARSDLEAVASDPASGSELVARARELLERMGR